MVCSWQRTACPEVVVLSKRVASLEVVVLERGTGLEVVVLKKKSAMPPPLHGFTYKTTATAYTRIRPGPRGLTGVRDGPLSPPLMVLWLHARCYAW